MTGFYWSDEKKAQTSACDSILFAACVFVSAIYSGYGFSDFKHGYKYVEMLGVHTSLCQF